MKARLIIGTLNLPEDVYVGSKEGEPSLAHIVHGPSLCADDFSHGMDQSPVMKRVENGSISVSS